MWRNKNMYITYVCIFILAFFSDRLINMNSTLWIGNLMFQCKRQYLFKKCSTNYSEEMFNDSVFARQ